MGKRAIVIVLDSFGVGEAPDANDFGDLGADTLKSVTSSEEFHCPNMGSLGLFDLEGIHANGHHREGELRGRCAKLAEISKGKDTTIGHWEIAGLWSLKPLPVYPKGFPKEVLDLFTEKTGRGVLCNKPYSGTDVIRDYGDEHLATGKLIVYTSADSVFQIAAHEELVPVEQLYEYCRIAREILVGDHGVGRVIARPFVGQSGNYTRTSRRHDFSLLPPGNTMLDEIKASGKEVLAVGKINDIFAGKGITEYVYTSGNEDGINRTLEYLDRDFEGLLFVNLVDYDMLYGHRRDIPGYAKALSYFDGKLPEILGKLGKDDILIITADHGCDPGFLKTTDHTREYVPCLMYGAQIEPGYLGIRSTFSDIAKTVTSHLEIYGTSIQGLQFSD